MHITSGATGYVGALRSNGGAVANATASKSEKTRESKDTLSVSSNGQLLAAANEKIAEIPSVRASLVEAIKSQIDSGSYNPDARAVVDGLLRDYAPAGGS